MREDMNQAWWRVVRLCGSVSNRYGHFTNKVRVMLDNGCEVEFFANSWEEAVDQFNRFRPASRTDDTVKAAEVEEVQRG